MTAPVGRTVVLGGSGFVGQELVRAYGCVGTSSIHRDGFTAVDATRREDLDRVIHHLRPNLVINSIGLADVDRSEREPLLADSLNHRVVENIVAVQRERPFFLVQISTDYVFDGTRGRYSEEDRVHPINEYGRSKLAGEQAVASSSQGLILRISSPYGPGFGARKPQFFRYVADSLRAGKPVRALTDQTVSATYLPDLSHAIPALVLRNTTGVVNIGSEEPLTRFDFALKVAKEVEADPRLVVPGRRSDMTQWVAERPADTSLDVRRSVSYGVSYTPVAQALHDALSA